ncbi:replication initiation factor domain-containing protein [Massilia sp. BJB1822]|uniref:replication initiation factor domain-containing protein n=1 Tax=Massilia sp. BJB1822 TaxID=2744470 RepID=UPI0015948E61|nr:replication initiation factor domain-containing protein [Massilia sp. BJB1822]NVD97950.1 replication initiation factor domain-containing protein [Massilia sp. BJB1822]
MTAAAGLAQVRGAAARRGGAEGSPRTVIRGESDHSQRLAIIDWLRFTFLPYASTLDTLEQLKRYFALWFPLPVNFVPAEKGMFGYKSSYDLMVWVDGEFIRVGVVAMGGTSAGNTMMVDLSGKGCSMVGDWQAVYATMQDLDARITRADTALDLYEGFTLEQFDDLYRAGEFNCGGRIPTRRYYEGGDSNDLHAHGRTLYLGKKANGKELCIYEKGKQLGDPDSEWLRIEIRFGNRDRVIPHEIVLDPTRFFAGGFVALEDLVNSIAEKIKTEQRDIVIEERAIVLKRLTHYLIAAYGKTLYQLAKEMNYDYQALYELLRVKGVPRRLEKTAVAGGVYQAHDPACSME